MAYDEGLAERAREIIAAEPSMEEKHMFGGIAWMVHGYMAVGIVKDELMVRIGKDADDTVRNQPHVRPMDFTGKPMAGYVFVAQDGLRTKKELASWIKRGINFVESLPPKGSKPAKKR